MKDELHVMVDIETTSLRPDAAVLAIGARLFTVNGPSKGFETFIDPTTAMTIGISDPDTVDWWRKQTAYELVWSGRIDPADGAHRFLSFVELHEPAKIWANSPQFDCVILRHLFKQVGIRWPFSYKDERDVRTITDLGRTLGIEVMDLLDNPARVAHNPLDDATTQAEVVSRILKGVLSTPVVRLGLGSDLRPTVPSQPELPLASTATGTGG